MRCNVIEIPIWMLQYRYLTSAHSVQSIVTCGKYSEAGAELGAGRWTSTPQAPSLGHLPPSLSCPLNPPSARYVMLENEPYWRRFNACVNKRPQNSDCGDCSHCPNSDPSPPQAAPLDSDSTLSHDLGSLEAFPISLLEQILRHCDAWTVCSAALVNSTFCKVGRRQQGTVQSDREWEGGEKRGHHMKEDQRMMKGGQGMDHTTTMISHPAVHSRSGMMSRCHTVRAF